MPPLLEVDDLHMHFFTRDGVVKAVDGVSFTLECGKTLGVVGESGSGKSVTALSIMRLIPEPPGKVVSGDIRFKGESILQMSEKEQRKLRGNRIAMIFQDPMTSLNPVYRIGKQIAEPLRLHKGSSTQGKLGRGRRTAHSGGHTPSGRPGARLSPRVLWGHAAKGHDSHGSRLWPRYPDSR